MLRLTGIIKAGIICRAINTVHITVIQICSSQKIILCITNRPRITVTRERLYGSFQLYCFVHRNYFLIKSDINIRITLQGGCNPYSKIKKENYSLPVVKNFFQSSSIFPFITLGNFCWAPILPFSFIKSRNFASGSISTYTSFKALVLSVA